MAKASVVNVKTTDTYDVYVGRGFAPHSGKLESQLGNPFIIGQHGNRAEVIRLYASYFKHRMDTDPGFRARIDMLKGKVLGCWCSPLPCHADIIAAHLNSEVTSP